MSVLTHISILYWNVCIFGGMLKVIRLTDGKTAPSASGSSINQNLIYLMWHFDCYRCSDIFLSPEGMHIGMHKLDQP